MFRLIETFCFQYYCRQKFKLYENVEHLLKHCQGLVCLILCDLKNNTVIYFQLSVLIQIILHMALHVQKCYFSIEKEFSSVNYLS